MIHRKLSFSLGFSAEQLWLIQSKCAFFFSFVFSLFILLFQMGLLFNCTHFFVTVKMWKCWSTNLVMKSHEYIWTAEVLPPLSSNLTSSIDCASGCVNLLAETQKCQLYTTFIYWLYGKGAERWQALAIRCAMIPYRWPTCNKTVSEVKGDRKEVCQCGLGLLQLQRPPVVSCLLLSLNINNIII